MMEANITHAGGMRFEVALGSGYEMQIDASRESGGEGMGARPMELLLAGLAGCTGMDVIGMMRKARQEVTGYEVRVSGERAGDYPMVFTSINVEHVVRGRGISEEALKRAIHLSETKYCSASAMLGTTAKINTSYRIVEE
jgi:putative redox protein